MIDDRKIYDFYMKGFNDELRGTTSTVNEGLQLRAYKLGAKHAIIGDGKTSMQGETISSRTKWEADKNTPLFTDDRSYIDDIIPSNED